MATLGYAILLTTFVVCSYAVGVSVAGARRRSQRLIDSGIGAFHMVTALMVMASVLIVRAFVTDDFTIRYVSRYSDSVQPLFFKLTSYWGGLDGSIMFWVFLLACFGSLAVHVNRDRHRELIPYVVAVISVVQMFFLFLMIIHNNPFDTYLTETPPDGNGLSPLLQNIYMVIHPPSLYIGLVGMTIPFAFGMAALITGHLDDAWLRAVRRWTMFAWFFLTFGLTLGMIWAYEELGWGGFWGWDPVENAGALPWFTATAFFHSVMVQERRSMLRVWNVTLVILTFFLTIFGTFMTRSGVVQSVHSFGENPELAMMFSIFMVVILVFSFGLVIYRLPLLRASNELDSWASREAAFLLNNWILLFSAFFILFVTMFPTVSEAITGERITIGPPFFNRWMVPIGLILLLLTGIGPLLAWRKTTVSNLKYQFLWPGIGALISAVLVLVLRVRVWSSGICFVLAGFVLGTICAGILARRRHPAQKHRDGPVHRDDWPRRAFAAPLWRIHRPRRHRADVPRICRSGLQTVGDGPAEAGPADGARRVYGAHGRPARHPGQPEADDHRPLHVVPQRRGSGEDVSGALVLQQARRAHHRGRDPALGV